MDRGDFKQWEKIYENQEIGKLNKWGMWPASHESNMLGVDCSASIQSLGYKKGEWGKDRDEVWNSVEDLTCWWETRFHWLGCNVMWLCFRKADLEQIGRERTWRQERTSENRSSSKRRAEQLPGKVGTQEGQVRIFHLTGQTVILSGLEYFLSYQNNGE